MQSILTMAAGLAFFLYGVERLGKLLARSAGGRVQELLDRFVDTDAKRYGYGLAATVALQSSSAVSVLLVGMTSAGLITATEAFSVILGANLGSVSTGWIAAFKVTALGLPLFVVGVMGNFLPFGAVWRRVFAFCIGLGVILFGLALMGDAVAAVRENRRLIALFAQFDVVHSFGALCLSVLFGVLFTAVIQSSGATLTIAVAAVSGGLFSLEQGCALSLGATLGTTVTAAIAAIRAGTEGRRLALLHAGTNFLGVLGGIVLFYPLVKLMAWTVPLWGSGAAVSAYLTAHKILLSLVMFRLRHVIVAVTERIVPDLFPGVRQRLTVPAARGLSGEMCQQARSQIALFYRYLRDMFAFSLIVALQRKHGPLMIKIEQYEQIVDQGHKRIVRLLHDLADQPQTERWLLLKMSAEAESMGDHLKAIASYGRRIRERIPTPHPVERLLVHSAHRRVFTMFHRVCVVQEFRREDLAVCEENELAIRRDKRRLLLSLTEGPDLLDPDTVLEVADILSEYSKVNHSVRRVLQVNLDMIEGLGIYRYDPHGSPADHPSNGD